MEIKTYKVKQYNSTYKHILCIDDVPIIATKSSNRMSQCVAYLSDDTVEINDGAIKKILDGIKADMNPEEVAV